MTIEFNTDTVVSYKWHTDTHRLTMSRMRVKELYDRWTRNGQNDDIVKGRVAKLMVQTSETIDGNIYIQAIEDFTEALKDQFDIDFGNSVFGNNP